MPNQDYTKWRLPKGAKARFGKGRINEIKYSSDSKRLAVASSIGIWLYDARTGKELDLLTKDMNWVNSVSFSRDNRYLVSGGANGKLYLWESATRKLIKTLVGHTSTILSVCFSPNGKTLASGTGGWYDDEQTVRLWDIATGTNVILSGYTHNVLSVCFSSDGKTLANGTGGWYDDNGESRGGKVELWDVKTKKLIKMLSTYTSSVNSVCFSDDDRFIAGGSGDGTVWIWDAETGELIKRLKGLWHDAIRSVAFSGDNRLLAGSSDGTVRLWDVETEKHTTLTGHTAAVTSVSFNSNRSQFASGSEDGTVRLWSNPNYPYLRTHIIGHASSINNACFSCNGDLLAGGSMDGTVRLWDVKNREHIITLRGQTDFVSSVSFSPDGCLLASSGGDRTVKLWNVENRTYIKILGEFEVEGVAPSVIVLRGHTDPVRSISFSPDGCLLASGGGTLEFLGSVYI